MANLTAFPNFLAPATPFEHGLVMFADLLFFIHYLANKAAGARASFMAEIQRLTYRSDPRIIEYISGLSGLLLGTFLVFRYHLGYAFVGGAAVQLIMCHGTRFKARAIIAMYMASHWFTLVLYSISKARYTETCILIPLLLFTGLLVFMLLCHREDHGGG